MEDFEQWIGGIGPVNQWSLTWATILRLDRIGERLELEKLVKTLL